MSSFRPLRASAHVVGVTALLVAVVPVSTAAAHTPGRFMTIDFPGAVLSFGSGVNDLGVVVGEYYGSDAVGHGFIEKAGRYRALPDDPNASPTPDHAETAPSNINDFGVTAGTYFDRSGAAHGYVYQNGKFTTIDDPLGTLGTYINDVNNLGVIVGDYVDSAGLDHGFVYHHGRFTTVDAPGATVGTIIGFVNDAGTLAGDAFGATTSYGFVDRDGTFATIKDPVALNSTVVGFVNDAREIGGDYIDSSGESHGFVDLGGTFTTIDDPNATVGGGGNISRECEQPRNDCRLLLCRQQFTSSRPRVRIQSELGKPPVGDIPNDLRGRSRFL